MPMRPRATRPFWPFISLQKRTTESSIYIVDTVAELLNDDFYPFSRKDFDCDAKRLFPIDTRECYKVKEAPKPLQHKV